LALLAPGATKPQQQRYQGEQKDEIPGSKERTNNVGAFERLQPERVPARRHPVQHQAWGEEQCGQHQHRTRHGGPCERRPAWSGEPSIREEEQQQRQEDEADELESLEEGGDHAAWKRAGVQQRLGGIAMSQLAAGKGEPRYQHQPPKDQLRAPHGDHQADSGQHEERKITQRRKVPGLAEGAGLRDHPQGEGAHP